jgi:P63C domain
MEIKGLDDDSDNGHKQDNSSIVDDRQLVLGDILRQTEYDAEIIYQKKITKEKEKIGLLGGGITSEYEEKEKIRALLADDPQEYEPKFSEIFAAFGKMMKWPPEIIKAWKKPKIVPDTIIECIYDRFPSDVKKHIHSKNPYIKELIKELKFEREHRYYAFITKDAIKYLDVFIDDVVTILEKSDNISDFRLKFFETHGTTFQWRMF